MPAPACSFCGSTDHVQKLFDMEPAVYACESCAALQRSIVGGDGGTGGRDDVRILRNWTTVEVGGETYNWMASRTTVSKNGGPSEPMVMITVQKKGHEAHGVLHADGTEPTEALAVKAIRKLHGRL